MKRPITLCAVLAFCISVAAAYESIALACVLAGIAALLFGIYAAVKNKKFFVFCLIFALLFASGMYFNAVIKNTAEIGKSKTKIRGTVTAIDTEYADVKYTVAIKSGKLAGSNAAFTSNNVILSVGDVADITAECCSDTSYCSEKVFLLGKIENIEIIGTDKPTAFLEKMRCKITECIFNNTSPESAATLCALTIGDKEYLPAGFTDSVRKAGLSHVLVVSGMHMAVLCGGLIYLLEKSRLSRFLRISIGAAFVLLFMALCGFTPSVMRAGITYFLMLVSLLLMRKSDAVSSLCAAVTVCAIINPFIAGSISFLLSVSATAGVLVVYPYFKAKFDFKNKFLSEIYSIFLISISALICTMPVTIIFFRSVNFAAIISNVLVSFAVSASLIFAAVGILLSAVGGGIIAKFPFFIADILIKYFNFTVKLFG